MKAEIYDEKKEKTVKRFSKSEIIFHSSRNDPSYARNPHCEILIENFPKKGNVLIMQIALKEIIKEIGEELRVRNN